MKRVSIIFKAL